MERATQNEYIEQACDFLCTIDDPHVCYNFPYMRNCCKKVKNVSALKPEHQRDFCLSSKHIDCIIFKQDKPKKLPRGILNNRRKNKTSLFLKFGVIGLFFLIGLGLVQSYGIDVDWDQSVSNQVVQNSDSPLTTISSVPSTTLQNTESTQVTLTNFVYAQESKLTQNQIVITSTSGPGFSTPFGPNQEYVVHQIQRGESLRFIADLYDVPIDSLHSINSLLEGFPIWVDQIIIVKLGVTTGPYEKLDAIQILGDTPIEIVADQYFTTAEKLIELNDLGDSGFLPAGRWLIVPHQ